MRLMPKPETSSGKPTQLKIMTVASQYTGAPEVAGDVVVIGNGGAEYDVRGYVSAFDLETGKLKWRF